MRTPKTDSVRTVNLLVASVSFHRSRPRAGDSRAHHTHPRLTGRQILVVAASLLALSSIDAIPAVAATTGSNASSVALSPPMIRSITVTPTTAAFGNCSGPNGSGTNANPSELAFPNGQCEVGLVGQGGVTGGVTITNGDAAGSIEVNGQNATPADPGGNSWSLLPSSGVPPGVDQFFEATNGSALGTANNNLTAMSTMPTCDTAFSVVNNAGSCAAAAGQSSDEALVMEGPSATSDPNGPFTITTTWTAVP